ncbi:MAG TPA: hypothetical protein VLI67_11585, partial [Vicinamibacteria bacterium]|nr:hypothetical protein [Vicinamibacteria bacterium]
MAVAAPPGAAPSIRQRVLEQGARIRRVKLVDRLAVGFITFGGIFVIVAVSFIFVFMVGESLPLFRPAHGEAKGAMSLAGPLEPGPPLVIGVDEYQMYVYEVRRDGRTLFFRAADGSFAREFPPASLAGARVASASRSLTGDYVALGTSDGRVSLQQVRFRPRYEDQKLADLDVDVLDRGLVELDPGRRPIREVVYGEADGRKTVAAVVAVDEILVYRTTDEGTEERQALRTRDAERVSHVRLGRSDTLIAAGERGNLYHWELSPEARLTEVVKVSEEPITAVEHTLGGVTAVVGDTKGNLTGWFRARLRDEDAELKFVKAHTYP